MRPTFPRKCGVNLSCYICGMPMEVMKLDPRDMKTRPCSHCESIINEMVNEAGDDDEYELLDDDDEELDEEYTE